MSECRRELREPVPDLCEHLVAGIVTERVVDRLEVVQVDVEHSKAAGLPLQICDSRESRSMKATRFARPVTGSCWDLVSQGALRSDLGGHVTRDAEGTD